MECLVGVTRPTEPKQTTNSSQHLHVGKAFWQKGLWSSNTDTNGFLMHETQRGVPKQNATIGNADGLGFETALFLKLNSGGGAYQRTARA